jgi:hypothetical protein
MVTAIEHNPVIEEIRDVYGEETSESELAVIVDGNRLNSRELTTYFAERSGMTVAEATTTIREMVEAGFIEIEPGKPVRLLQPPVQD